MCTHHFSKQCFKENANIFLRPVFNRYVLTERGVCAIPVKQPAIRINESLAKNDVSSLDIAGLFFHIEDTYNLTLPVIDTDKIDTIGAAYDVFRKKLSEIRKHSKEKQSE